MKIFNYPSRSAEKRIDAIVNRGLRYRKKDYLAVNRILEDVRKNGDQALISYANRFDSPGLKIGSLKVSAGEFEAAAGRVDRTFMRALNRARCSAR